MFITRVGSAHKQCLMAEENEIGLHAFLALS